jgi:hypothetical protein
MGRPETWNEGRQSALNHDRDHDDDDDSGERSCEWIGIVEETFERGV